jgi:hypothetical protein
MYYDLIILLCAYWEERPYYDNVRMCEKFYIPSVLFDFVCNAETYMHGERNYVNKKQTFQKTNNFFL